MDIKGRHVVVTGAASGIGRALARGFAAAGARAVVVADRDGAAAESVAAEFGGLAVLVDVGRESEIADLVAAATRTFGPVDVFCSNAGFPGSADGVDTSDAEWQQAWQVNVSAHLWAARALLPQMLARGEGYLVNTASAAGLLTQVSALSYTVTKHAAVALAEWLAINHGARGVRVSCVCPQAVQTPMLDAALADPVGAATVTSEGVLTPEQVADAVLAGVRAEEFLILPHPAVAQKVADKGSDPGAWVSRMQRLVEGRRPVNTPQGKS